MNARVRHLPFRRLGTSEVHLRYLEEDPELAPVFGVRPRDPGDLLEKAPLEARRLVPRPALAAAFRRYAERHGAPPEVLESVRRLEHENALVVVTGQQPGLLGGPLYTVHKAATAVRLARELAARPGSPPVVPVFWNHSDDHDLDEVNRAFVVNPNQDLQRLRLPIEHDGEPLCNIAVGRELGRVLAAVGDLLPNTEFRDEAFAIFTPREADETLGDGLARLLFAMFGADGLLVIEPRDLPAEAFDVLPKWRAREDEIRGRVRSMCDHLSDVGLDVTLDPATTLMFQIGAGRRRVPLTDTEVVEDPRQLSPGVLLRPLWQDACLPTIGFVVGPGELAYLAAVGALYKTLGVPRPCFVPRASLTLFEPSMVKHLDRFGWDLPDLNAGPEVLAQALEAGDEDGPDALVQDASADLRRRLGEVAEILRQADPQMVGQLERARGKVVDELDKLAGKIRNARQNRQGTGLRQVRRLCAHLRPRGRMQERVLGPLPFLVSHGARPLAEILVAAADPFAVRHGVVEL